MKYFAQYDDVLPGEVYAAKFGENAIFSPQGKQEIVDYMTGKNFKFKSKANPDLFQRFLQLQGDGGTQELFSDVVNMPTTPFGNLASYMGS
jgi:hypothetical protein